MQAESSEERTPYRRIVDATGWLCALRFVLAACAMGSTSGTD
jgi:hypothetical protein